MDTNYNQIKSKKRVADRGEVFTAEREVKAMCDLVKDETERIDNIDESNPEKKSVILFRYCPCLPTTVAR